MPWPPAKRLVVCVLLRIKLALLCPLGRDTDYLPGTGAVWGPADIPFEETRLTGDRAVWEGLGRQLRAHPELRVAGPSIGWFGAALAEMAMLRRAAIPDLPALVIGGSADDVVCEATVADRLRGWTRASRLRLEGARHEVLMETPPLRAAAISAACDLFDCALGEPEPSP
jgi:lysophospholipase